MQARYYDDRIGYITTDVITDFDLNPQGSNASVLSGNSGLNPNRRIWKNIHAESWWNPEANHILY
jgi:hypothetical protein